MVARQRNMLLLAAFVLCISVFTVYGLRTWEWGLMDDLQYVVRGHQFTSRYGLWRGILEGTRSAMHGDIAWGLIRPGYWVYSSSIYLLPPTLAYFLRFLNFGGILVFAILIAGTVASRATQKPALLYYGCLLLTLLAIHPLYDTLGFISLQEYSGLLFALGGVYLLVRERGRGSHWAAALGIILAASFKMPFIWLLLAVGVGGIIQRKRTAFSAACVVAALTSIAGAAYVARGGAYTAHIAELQLSAVINTILHFGFEFAVPAVIMLLIFWASLRFRRGEHFASDFPAAQVGVAGVAYFANLLPWGSPKYHMGPPAFLICLGAFLFLAPRFEIKPERRKALAVSALLSLAVCAHGIWKCVARDVTIQEMRDWALKLPKEGSMLAINGRESSGRLHDLLDLRGDGNWPTSVLELGDTLEEALDGGAPTAQKPDYYIVFSDQGPGNPKLMQNPVIQFPLATVYKLEKGRSNQ